ncbi:MAG: glycosyltransferase, partial [archaeon]
MVKKELSVSVIMPTFEINKSEDALRDIFKQNYPLNEVIVINDNPNSEIPRSMLKFMKDNKIKLIKNHVNMGAAKSINEGILASKSDVIIVVCRDHFMESNAWIRHIVEKLSSDKKIGLVSCPYVWPTNAWRSYNFL